MLFHNTRANNPPGASSGLSRRWRQARSHGSAAGATLRKTLARAEQLSQANPLRLPCMTKRTRTLTSCRQRPSPRSRWTVTAQGHDLGRVGGAAMLSSSGCADGTQGNPTKGRGGCPDHHPGRHAGDGTVWEDAPPPEHLSAKYGTTRSLRPIHEPAGRARGGPEGGQDTGNGE